MIRGVLRPVSRAVIHSRRRGVLRALAAIAGLSGLAGCAPMAAALGGLAIPRHGHHLEHGLAYGDEARQRLDVYRPAAATPAATLPAKLPAKVIVYFYGGSWRSGERGYYRFVGEAFASRGFVVVVPDYRLYPDVRFPAFVEDGAQAVRWVYDHIAGFGGCGRRVFLMGHSAGAHTAALLAVDGRYLAAAGVPAAAIRGLIGLAGPYAIDPAQYRLTRAVFAGSADRRTAQPTALVTPTAPPALLLHGARDRLVSPANSEAFAAALRAHGGCAESVILADAGHIDLVLALGHPFRRQGGIRDRIAAFIDRL